MNKEVGEVKEYKGFNKVFYYIIIFFIASIIGYVYEVVYYLVDDKILVNRGFLYGPWLPVYGFGAILMIVTLKRFKKHPAIIFLLAMILTGLVEYAAGFAIDKVYHEKWWDYTGLFLNINGYVCLRSVASFAVGALVLFYFLEPLISKKIMPIDFKKKKIIFLVLTISIVIDLALTVIFRHPL